MSQSILTIRKEFGCASSLAGDHWLSASHALDNHHPERFRLSAGMYDHIQSAHGRGRVFQKSGETDSVAHPQSVPLLAKLSRRPLTTVCLIDGAADDVSANRHLPGQTSQS